MEVVTEETICKEIICIKTKMFGNVGPTACIEPPKKATQTIGQEGPCNVLRFGSDRRGIASYGMFVEAAEEDELTLEKAILVHARPAVCIGPPKRPA